MKPSKEGGGKGGAPHSPSPPLFCSHLLLPTSLQHCPLAVAETTGFEIGLCRGCGTGGLDSRGGSQSLWHSCFLLAQVPSLSYPFEASLPPSFSPSGLQSQPAPFPLPALVSGSFTGLLVFWAFFWIFRLCSNHGLCSGAHWGPRLPVLVLTRSSPWPGLPPSSASLCRCFSARAHWCAWKSSGTSRPEGTSPCSRLPAGATWPDSTSRRERYCPGTPWGPPPLPHLVW